VGPFELFFKSSAGSGYDIACAQANGPILFEREPSGPRWTVITYDPPFKDQLFFLCLGKKINSRDAIDFFLQKGIKPEGIIRKLSAITEETIQCKRLPDFECLMLEHEKLLSRTLDIPRAKDLHFPDYWGEIKSLGGWGGDMVLVTSDRPESETRKYFDKRGYGGFYNFKNLVLKSGQDSLFEDLSAKTHQFILP
jgi:hypothetical protein